MHNGHEIPYIECNLIEIATKLQRYTIGCRIKVGTMHKQSFMLYHNFLHEFNFHPDAIYMDSTSRFHIHATVLYENYNLILK